MHGVARQMAGLGMNSIFMTSIMASMQTQMGTIPLTGFTNYSGMFRNMTSHSSFWSNGDTPLTAIGGGMKN
jgi:hypothetical protein